LNHSFYVLLYHTLILKTSGATFSVLDEAIILKKVDAIKKTITGAKFLPNVYVLHGELTTEEMNSLYNHPKVKAHISLTHGEGFGRPLAEAAASGKPVIASNWSGHIDFLDKRYSILLPGALTQLHSSIIDNKLFLPEAAWFSVNHLAVKNAMIDVMKSYKQHKLNASRQASIIQNKFSLDAMAEKLNNILDAKVPEQKVIPLALPKLVLPKLNTPKLMKI